MNATVEALTEVLGDIRVAGARQADWWEDDETHTLLIRVLRGECIEWTEGLLDSDWLRAHDAEVAAKALRDAADEMNCHPLPEKWLRDRADGLAERIDQNQDKP